MDIFNSLQINDLDAEKIKEHLDKIKAAQTESSELASILGVAADEFNKFFKNYGKPYFTAHKFVRHSTPRSELYNENILTLEKDLARLYSMTDAATKTTLKAFNYAEVVSKELVNSATIAASKVLDLNILSEFVKGKVIVAGDDFYNGDLIDTAASNEFSQSEIVEGTAAMGLARDESVFLTDPGMEITVKPLKPTNKGGSVNSAPTAGNVERFYEGKFYAYVGEQEPEGGELNIQFMVDPTELIGIGTTYEKDGKEQESEGPSAEDAAESAQGAGFFAIVVASEEAKQVFRQKMIDGDPSSFWQAEYVYATAPLIDPFDKSSEEYTLDANIDKTANVGLFGQTST
jgi:hypothetical protein